MLDGVFLASRHITQDENLKEAQYIYDLTFDTKQNIAC